MNISKISLTSFDDSKLRRDSNAKTISFFCKTRPVKIDCNVILEVSMYVEETSEINISSEDLVLILAGFLEEQLINIKQDNINIYFVILIIIHSP